jgi:hypothetical protein
MRIGLRPATVGRGLAAAFSTLALAAAAGATSVGLVVDGGTPIDLGLSFDESGIATLDGTSCGSSAQSGACLVEVAGAWRVEIFAELDPDPSIGYAVAVTDFGAASTFAFSFLQPIVATTAPGLVLASLSGSTTNGGGVPGSVTVTPMAPPAGIPVDGDLIAEIAVYTLSQNAGVTYLNAGQDFGPLFSSNPLLISDVYGPFNGVLAAGPAGAGSYNQMRVDVNFMLPGGGDILTFNGSAFVIPEPATLSLLALGLGALAAAGRPRARSRQRSA